MQLIFFLHLLFAEQNSTTDNVCKAGVVSQCVKKKRRMFCSCPYKSAATRCYGQRRVKSRRKWDLTHSIALNSHPSHVNKWQQIPVGHCERGDCLQPGQTLVEKWEWRVVLDPSGASLRECREGIHRDSVFNWEQVCVCVHATYWAQKNTHSMSIVRTYFGNEASPHILKRLFEG